MLALWMKSALAIASSTNAQLLLHSAKRPMSDKLQICLDKDATITNLHLVTMTLDTVLSSPNTFGN